MYQEIANRRCQVVDFFRTQRSFSNTVDLVPRTGAAGLGMPTSRAAKWDLINC